VRVDYLANPIHGLELSATKIAMVTGVIPSITRLASTYFWGWLFDRMNFFLLRFVVNAIFLSGVMLYFLSGHVTVIAVGSALFGLARGGGEILWNLWVTKLNARDKIASYMSIHTFMTGLRVAIAPFMGFYLVKLFGLSSMLATSVAFIVWSFVLIWPLLKEKSFEAASPEKAK
ncbi:MAG: MFS transporter, partial [Verrucomicrobiota bacterium]